MKTFYRLEDRAGRGVYNAGFSLWDCLPGYAKEAQDDELNRLHPPPWEDSLLVSNLEAQTDFWDNCHTRGRPAFRDCMEWRFMEGEDYRFGFIDIASVRRWFHRDDWLEILGRKGIYLATYQINDEDLIEGYTQCMFIWDKAERIHRTHLYSWAGGLNPILRATAVPTQGDMKNAA